jgi:hypothetical protein
MNDRIDSDAFDKLLRQALEPVASAAPRHGFQERLARTVFQTPESGLQPQPRRFGWVMWPAFALAAAAALVALLIEHPHPTLHSPTVALTHTASQARAMSTTSSVSYSTLPVPEEPRYFEKKGPTRLISSATSAPGREGPLPKLDTFPSGIQFAMDWQKDPSKAPSAAAARSMLAAQADLAAPQDLPSTDAALLAANVSRNAPSASSQAIQEKP